MPINTPKQPIQVMVVDDSAYMRLTITRYLNDSPGIRVIAAARDGLEALEMLEHLAPDVITLDVEMPRLDGLSTLRKIMAKHPLPVIMLSSLTTEGASETIQALTLGAVDFVSKPKNKANVSVVMEEVADKIRKAIQVKIQPALLPLPDRLAARSDRIIKPTRAMLRHDRIVVIGSSTGGPRALNVVIPELPVKLAAAVLVVQHMPAGFTHSLAERLDSSSALKVKEAEPGEKPEVGKVLLAPGGFHMTLNDLGEVTLNQNPPVHGVRPAIDVTLASVVKYYGAAVIGVILTGMGNDGTNGCSLIHNSGGRVITEDESTCVVYGMPRSVVESHLTDEIVPLPEIAQRIYQATMTPTPFKTVR
jgi:two-component system, chemotaxis family, protein-glutamate methylesterase/glutaminase